MYGKKVLNQLSAYKQGKQTEEVQKEFKLDKIVKLASNENPYGYSQSVNDLFIKPEQHFEIYPDGYALKLREKLAKKLHVDKDELIFGNGSDEIITLICRGFLYEGVNTVMARPTFTQYKHHSLIEGADVREIPTVEGYHDLTKMCDAIDKETKVVWICSPDNPTGTLINEREFEKFMTNVPKETLVVLDEAYFEFVTEEKKYSTNKLLNKYGNLIILRTFSKAYGLAGLRIGYGIMSLELVSKLNVIRGAFNTSAIAQSAALKALEDDGFINRTVSKNERVKLDFVKYLKENGFEVYDSETNFILVKVPIDGNEASLKLLKKGFIVRSGELLGYKNTIRITIGLKEDMEELKEVMLELK